MQTKRIIDILKTDNVGISCELFPPKQGTELQNSLEIVNKIAQVHPSYMSVTYGAGGSTVGYSAALAKEVQDNDIPALAHLTCVKADEEKQMNEDSQDKDFHVMSFCCSYHLPIYFFDNIENVIVDECPFFFYFINI